MDKMNREQAIEACAKALAKRRGYVEESWKQQPKSAELAADIVAALEALELFKPQIGKPSTSLRSFWSRG
jgi:hypothetical protein